MHVWLQSAKKEKRKALKGENTVEEDVKKTRNDGNIKEEKKKKERNLNVDVNDGDDGQSAGELKVEKRKGDRKEKKPKISKNKGEEGGIDNDKVKGKEAKTKSKKEKKEKKKDKKKKGIRVEDIDSKNHKADGKMEDPGAQIKKIKEEKASKKRKSTEEQPFGDTGNETSNSPLITSPSSTHPAKKVKFNNANQDTIATTLNEDYDGYSSGGKQSNGGTAAKAFQRVKADEWLGKKGSWDNSYEGTFGQDGWGYKAQQILGQVRGKDFRHEKTKKKRGSYRGGTISSEAVYSYKFESDDE